MAIDANPLVSTDWLTERLRDAKVRPVDASWWFPHEARNARAEFEAAHIPGAVFFDIDAIAQPETALPHMLATPEGFAEAVGALGIDDDATVVVYAADPTRSAARVWWTFRAMGHENVVVLDGGLKAWRAEGRSLQMGAASLEPAVFTSKVNSDLVRSAADIRAALNDEGRQIVDARPAPRFRGEAPEPRAGLRSGHMPGALSLPASDLFAPDGRMLEPPALERVLAEAGVDPNKPVISSCGSGITACNLALALARLGCWDAAVYDGSWAEWGALPDAPVVAGAPG